MSALPIAGSPLAAPARSAPTPGASGHDRTRYQVQWNLPAIPAPAAAAPGGMERLVGAAADGMAEVVAVAAQVRADLHATLHATLHALRTRAVAAVVAVTAAVALARRGVVWSAGARTLVRMPAPRCWVMPCPALAPTALWRTSFTLLAR